MTTSINAEYTQADHIAREDDRYAEAKYLLTLRWLAARRTPPAAPIINVGCGSGRFNVLAAQHGYSNVLGIEPDPAAIAIAQGNAPAGHRFASVGLFDASIVGGGFRAAVMHDVLEHIEDEAGAVDRLAELLAPEPTSTLVLSVPAWPALFGYHDVQLGHYRRYTPKSLRTALSPTFEIMLMRPLGLLGIPAAAYFSRLRGVPYPVGGGGLADRVLDVSCKLELKFVPPTGTSLLVVARPR